MKWLKRMLLLGVILCGVYFVLHKGSTQPPPPPGITKDWASPPNIQLGILDDDGPAQPNSSMGVAQQRGTTQK